MVTYFYQERADPSSYISTVVSIPDLSWLQSISQAAELRQYNNYTTRADVTGYLQNAVDISWMNSNSRLIIRPIVQVYSQRADIQWYLSPTAAPNLQWIQSGYQYVKSIPTYQSQRASTVGFLSPPLNVSWATNTYDIVLPSVVTRSSKVDPSGYISPPIDLSWLILVSNAQEIPQRTLNSFQSNTSSFLPIIIIPDLSWIQSKSSRGILVPGIYSTWNDPTWLLTPTPDISWLYPGNSVRIVVPGIESNYTNPTWFLNTVPDVSWIQVSSKAGYLLRGISSRYSDVSWFLNIPPPPDLSWLGVGEIIRIPTRLTSSTYVIPLSIITVIPDSLFIIEMNIIPSVDGVIKIQAFPINSSTSVIVKAGSVAFIYDV